MRSLPTNPPESFKKRNPHLYGGFGSPLMESATQKSLGFTPTPTKRIRQSTKPLMNKLEGRFSDHLKPSGKVVHAQSITFRLANGVRYTPDFFCFDWLWQGETRPVAWEVKGPWFTDDAKVKIKLFAAAYPWILVLLASEDKGTGFWHNQIVYP